MFDKIPGGKWAVIAFVIVGLYFFGVVAQKRGWMAQPEEEGAEA